LSATWKMRPRIGIISVFEPPLSETPSTPSSREVPNLKHQTPKSDAGANGTQFGFWAWSLVLFAWALNFSKIEMRTPASFYSRKTWHCLPIFLT